MWKKNAKAGAIHKMKTFLTILDSKVCAALITVLIGSIGAGILTNIFQGWQQDRELRNGIIQLSSQYQLELHKINLRGREKIANEAYHLVGQVMSRAGSMIDIEGPLFAKPRNKEDQEIMKKQKEQVRLTFNKTWEEWDTRKNSIGSLLMFYIGNDSSNLWNKMSNEMDGFLRCIGHFENNHTNENPRCRTRKKNVQIKFEKLKQTLNQSPPEPPWIGEKLISQIREHLKTD